MKYPLHIAIVWLLLMFAIIRCQQPEARFSDGAVVFIVGAGMYWVGNRVGKIK